MFLDFWKEKNKTKFDLLLVYNCLKKLQVIPCTISAMHLFQQFSKHSYFNAENQIFLKKLEQVSFIDVEHSHRATDTEL